MPSKGYLSPINVEVPPNYIPVNFVFRSASSQINVVQKHQSSSGSFRESYSEDEPHKLVHTVKRPVIQEVKEIITPYRKIVQQIEPVREEIQTIVARAIHSQNNQGDGGNRNNLYSSDSSMRNVESSRFDVENSENTDPFVSNDTPRNLEYSESKQVFVPEMKSNEISNDETQSRPFTIAQRDESFFPALMKRSDAFDSEINNSITPKDNLYSSNEPEIRRISAIPHSGKSQFSQSKISTNNDSENEMRN